ncbi:hypothetical protein MMC30_001148 [Trapelia coarctata]|nr:hypothetical protein [Trapelia coarctata]
MNSSNASNISGPKYGYDFVVATTQASINGTMMNFLSSRKEPVVAICYIADASGHPVPIDYTELKKRAQGSDPFAVPNGALPSTSNDLRNLFNARFMMGFRARLGLPRVPDPSKLPDIVTLGSDTSAVTFNMLCSEFTVVQLDPGNGWGGPSWMNQSQSATSPWVFTSKVDLRLSTVDASAYSTLPPDVQKKIMNVGSQAFSVQQLLFDLTNASLMTIPTISGTTPGTALYMILQQYFLGAYFTQMQKESQPLLGCSIVMHDAPISTLKLTSFNFSVNPYVDPNGQPYPKPTIPQQQLATLNYLCAANNHALPPAVRFNWNWVDASQLNDHDGTIAINRATFANYFRNQLAFQVSRSCILPHVRVYLSDPFTSTVNYSWTLTAGQTPTVTLPPTGKTVLRFDYTAESADEAGLNADMGKFRLKTTYGLTVDFVGKTIVVTQHLVVYMYIRSLQTDGEGNLVDKTITDTYTLGIDASGTLVPSLLSNTTDNSNSPSVNAALNFFTRFNDISNSVKDTVQAFAGSKLQDMPIATVQNYVFPGGKTFLFKNVGFSDYGDLVSFISYADPTGKAVPSVPSVPSVPHTTVSVVGGKAVNEKA